MWKKIILICFFLIPCIKVSAIEKYPVKIQKYDQFQSETTEAFKFKIKNIDNGQYILEHGSEIMTTRADGIYYSDFELEPGTYEIENIEYPFHYFPSNKNTRFTINEDTPFLDGYYDIKDYVKKDVGKIIITRLGKTIGPNEKVNYNKLEGYEYEIYAEGDVADMYGVVIYKGDELVDRIKTDKNGKAESKDLPFGEYYIKEVSGRKEYEKMPNLHNIRFAYNLALKREVIETREELISDHTPLYMNVTRLNEEVVDPRIKEDFSIRLCFHLTNECVKKYKLSDFDDGKENLNIAYGEYYLGLFLGEDMVQRYDIDFSNENNTLNAVYDFKEFKNEKGELVDTDFPEDHDIDFPKEDIILKLPQTGYKKSFLFYRISLILVTFHLYLGIKKSKNQYI